MGAESHTDESMALDDDMLALIDEELSQFDAQSREEEDEVNRLIREEMRMLSRQSTRLNVNERGERLKKMAQSRASREANRSDMRADIARRKRLAAALSAPQTVHVELVL